MGTVYLMLLLGRSMRRSFGLVPATGANVRPNDLGLVI